MKPLTHDTEPRQYRECKCQGCGKTALCTPDNDFYTRAGAPEPAPLFCKQCLFKSSVKLKIYPDLGGQVQAVFQRTDLPLMHSIVRANAGEQIPKDAVARHWPCSVCAGHGFTAEEFDRQWPQAIAELSARK